MSSYRSAAETDDEAVLQELERANKIVSPAAKKAYDYVEWVIDEISTMEGSIDPLLKTIMQHTDTWGIAQAILGEMKDLDDMTGYASSRVRSEAGLLSKGKVSKQAQVKTDLVRGVFMSKLLREIFLTDTNFKETVYGDR